LILALFLLTAVWLLFDGGQVIAGAVLLPVTTFLFAHQRRQQLAGACLHWRSGRWSVSVASTAPQPIDLYYSVCLPWVIAIFWREGESGVRREAWLFTDSAAVEDMRRLRVRLRLSH
tara:strand:- start:162339 stop:162689 length:351 start_codon:yes stop_codon:yes gene_type:complete